jgi:RNA polymerase sigma factor (sigma-70 family)
MQTEKDFSDEISFFVKKLKRRDRYERDRKKKENEEQSISYFGSDDDFGFASFSYERWVKNEQREKSYNALYDALEDLKLIDPAGHKLIIEYYFDGLTMTEIGKKHGISQQACSKKIHRCLKILENLVELHKCVG